MLYKPNDILKFNNCEIVIEIKNSLPGDQEIIPEFKNVDRYRVLVNGKEFKIPEKLIEVLERSQVVQHKTKARW